VIGVTNTAKQCLQARLADELHVDIMPVLVGGGFRALEEIDEGQIQLQRIKVMELPGGRTHLRFRIIKG
jgi:dihydrofolate reductase